MTRDATYSLFTDEELQAYLEDRLDAQTRAAIDAALEDDDRLMDRLAHLDSGVAVLEGAAAHLAALTPPRAALERTLEQAMDEVSRPRMVNRPTTRTPEWWLLAASIVIAFAGGVFIDAVLSRPSQEQTAQDGAGMAPPQAPTEPAPAPKRGWKKTVADYAALYTPSSFSGAPLSAAQLNAELDVVRTETGLALNEEDVLVPGFDLVRAQMLSFNGKPLAQLVYRDDAGRPVLFCIIRNTEAGETKPPAPGQLDGLQLVGWDADRFGYIVIGDAPEDSVQGLADVLAPRFS